MDKTNIQAIDIFLIDFLGLCPLSIQKKIQAQSEKTTQKLVWHNVSQILRKYKTTSEEHFKPFLAHFGTTKSQNR